jgi:predicted nucleic acid-binding Zn ribbon protein
MFHQAEYNDECGQDIHTDRHFCSAMCEKHFKRKHKILEGAK